MRDKEKKDSKYRRGTVQLDPVSCPPRSIISFLIKIPETLNEALCQIRPYEHSLCSELLFVTDITDYIRGEKYAMWRNVRFL